MPHIRIVSKGATSAYPLLAILLVALVIASSPRLFAQSTVHPLPQSSPLQTTPGVVIVSTIDELSNASRVARRLSDAGVFVLVYQTEDNVTARYLAWHTQRALDSLRRRNDIQRDKIGLVVAGQTKIGARWLQPFVTDTTLTLLTVTQAAAQQQDILTYESARIPVLIVQPPQIAFDTLSNVTNHVVLPGNGDRIPSRIQFARAVGQFVTVRPQRVRQTSQNGLPADETELDEMVQWIQNRLQLQEIYRPNAVRLSVVEVERED